MASPEDQRLFDARERGADPDCEIQMPQLVPDVDPQQDVPACDPVPEVTPDTFALPKRPPLPPLAPNELPRGVVLQCQRVDISCVAPTVNLLSPATSTVLRGEITSDFFLDDVPEIPTAELLRMPTVVDDFESFLDDRLHGYVSAGDPAFVYDLSVVLGVSEALAQIITAAIVVAQNDLDESATVLAQAGVDCGYRSQDVWAKCAENTQGYTVHLVDPGGAAGSVAFAPADTATSTESQALANESAARIAALTLQCVYPNETQTVTCADQDPIFGASFFYPTAADTSQLAGLSGQRFGPENELLVYSATVQAGTFTAVSTSEANSIAQAAAAAELNCFFPSRQAIAYCEADPTRFAEVDPGSYIGQTAENAYDQAAADAESQLVDLCVWGNREMTYACDDKDNDPADMAQVTKHLTENYPGVNVMSNKEGQPVSFAAFNSTIALFASPGRSAYFYTVRPGEITGRSQEEADTLAAAYALSQLSCVYCNPRVEPVCYLGLGETADLDLPIPNEDIQPFNSDPDNRWSTSATTGIPGVRYNGGTPNISDLLGNPEVFFCSSDPSEVAAVSDSFALVPSSVLSKDNNSCKFVNKELTVRCKDLQPENDGYFSTGPSAVLTTTVPAGTVEAATAEEADELAMILAQSQLNCFFQSPRLQIYCGATTDVGIPPAPYFVQDVPPDLPPLKIGTGILPGGEVHSTSAGSPTSPVVLNRGLALSYTSPEDAFRQALLIGIGQLNCFYKNKAQTVKCPKASNDIFAEGARVSYTVAAGKAPDSYVSQQEADLFARLIAESYLRCIYTNTRQVGGDCPSPGDYRIMTPVPQGTVTSALSTNDANKVAKALADGLLTCIPPDEFGKDGVDGENGKNGDPGPQGPAGNCDTPCTGFYA